MAWMAVAGIAASLIGGAMSKKAGDKQADAVENANRMAVEENRRQYDQTRSDYAPYRDAGGEAVNYLSAMLMGPYGIKGRGDAAGTDIASLQAQRNALQAQMGAGGGQEGDGQWVFEQGGGETGMPAGYRWVTNNGPSNMFVQTDKPIGDPSSLGTPGAPGGGGSNLQAQIAELDRQIAEAQGKAGQAGRYADVDANTSLEQYSPGYRFRLDEGNKALDRRQAAGSSRLGGRAVKEATRYNQDYASNEWGNYLNSIFNLAGYGSSATGGTAQAGAQAAGNISNAQMNTGNSLANIYGQQGANMNNALQSGFQNYAFSQYLNQNKVPGRGMGIGMGGGPI